MKNVLTAPSVWDLNCEHCHHKLTFARYSWYASLIGITLGGIATLIGVTIFEYSDSVELGVLAFFVVLFVVTGGHGTPSSARARLRERIEARAREDE